MAAAECTIVFAALLFQGWTGQHSTRGKKGGASETPTQLPMGALHSRLSSWITFEHYSASTQVALYLSCPSCMDPSLLHQALLLSILCWLLPPCDWKKWLFTANQHLCCWLIVVHPGTKQTCCITLQNWHLWLPNWHLWPPTWNISLFCWLLSQFGFQHSLILLSDFVLIDSLSASVYVTVQICDKHLSRAGC